MSYLQVTAARPSLRVSSQYDNTLRRSPAAPLSISCFHNSVKRTISSLKKCTELMKCNVIHSTGASRYEQCTTVCSFGGKGEPKSGNEASPWKSIEKAMSSFKKEQSLEDVLRQQMEKQDYNDGGSGGEPPSGGGGGGGGFGGTEDESFSDILDDFLQTILALFALILLYTNIVAGDYIKLFIRGVVELLSGKKGPRLRTLMYGFARFYQNFRCKVPYDSYWLEKAIIRTSTYYDSPAKYRRIFKLPTQAKKSKRNIYSDSDDNSFSTFSDNAYDDDSDDDDTYGKKSYNDDDDNAYSEDVDDN